MSLQIHFLLLGLLRSIIIFKLLKFTICCTDEFGVNYTIASLSIPTVSSFIKSIFFHGHTYSILNVTECTYIMSEGIILQLVLLLPFYIKEIWNFQIMYVYHKVSSINMSRLEARFRFYRLLMKAKIDVYLL